MVGVVFVFHGSQKLFGLFAGPGLADFAQFLQQLHVPAPQYMAVLAGAAEFFGGIALGLGLWSRIAVIPMIVTMLVAIVMVHHSAFSAQNDGMEYPLTLAVVLLGLGLTGPGKFSVGALLSTKRPVVPTGSAEHVSGNAE